MTSRGGWGWYSATHRGATHRGSVLAWLAVALVAVLPLLGAPGCSSPPESTRLQLDDFDLVVSELRDSLARYLTDRGPNTPPMRIETRPLRNESSDVLTKAEKWMAVGRVQAALPVQELIRVHGVTFQMPMRQVEALAAAGFQLPPVDHPTHFFKATLRSATRSGRDNSDGDTDLRKEYYEFSYDIVDAATSELVWSDSVTFAREAAGTVVN